MPPIRIPQAQQTVCWTGPESESVLYLPTAAARPLHLSFTVLAVMDYEVIQSFRLRVNGCRLPLILEPAPQDHFPYAHRFEGIVTPSLLRRQSGPARLEFCINRTFPEPVASEPALGPKLLGFCTDAITLQPV
ncbi:MAG: hypothetical protein RLZ98_243 [Pseudomonadota bacterium]|jgi:hypothetical protein